MVALHLHTKDKENQELELGVEVTFVFFFFAFFAFLVEGMKAFSSVLFSRRARISSGSYFFPPVLYIRLIGHERGGGEYMIDCSFLPFAGLLWSLYISPGSVPYSRVQTYLFVS